MNRSDTATEPAHEEVLSTIVGDRACASCGFNLYGQQVIREPHYGLIAARCPECGTLAALQEYPALGRWSRRWVLVLAAVWMVILIAVFAGTTMAPFGLAINSIEITSGDAGTLLAKDYTDWYDTLEDADQAQLSPSVFRGNTGSFGRWDVPDEAWPNYGTPATVIHENGGFWACADQSVIWFWMFMCFAGVPFGAFWSLSLLHQPPWKVVIVPAIAIIIAGALTIIAVMPNGTPPHRFDTTARILYTPRIMPVTLGVLLTSMAVSILLARPLARVMIRLALPPRMRVPFGVLWSSTGKPMPRPR